MSIRKGESDVEITNDSLTLFKKCMAKNKLKPGPLMPTLQDAQRIFECVPLEIQSLISNELKESLAKISGVVSFYTMFSTEPRGKHTIGVCTGTACYVKGAQKLVEKVCDVLKTEYGMTTEDGLFTIAPTRCLGNCGAAPVVMIDEDQYEKVTVDQIEEILSNYYK